MLIAKAIFAAGCFWGVQTMFDSLPGVISTEVGYAGGKYDNPSYEDVSTGRTGHAESVEVFYNPLEITYAQLLDAFFANHDPTTINRQGPDVGTQYRSVIFYEDAEQKAEALKKIEELDKSGQFKNKISTEVLPAEIFYPAEEYHQKYLQKKGRSGCSYRPTISPAPETTVKEKSNEEWKKELNPEQYRVLREKGTERPGTGKYTLNFADGTYKCAACGNPLFASDNKFKSASGWPSFKDAIPGSVEFHQDNSHGMQRVEVTCAKCGGHLGHIFQDMPGDNPNRFCINSTSLDFEEKQ